MRRFILQLARLLSNAFTIPGSILLMLGLLVLISSTGAYDGLTYVLRWLRMTLLPFGASKHERYYDDVQRRRTALSGSSLMIWQPACTGCLFA